MLYRPRLVDAELERRLSAMGAVVIEGPRACGKTATTRQIAASEVRLDVDQNARRAVGVDPSLVLEGPTPRLIDEWQTEPEIWNHIRRAIDDRGKPGQFILTGSAVPADDVTRHTGAGRIARLRMRPMTLFESGQGNGAVSLEATMAGEPVRASDPGLTVTDLAHLACRGGWPGYLHLEVPEAIDAVRSYLDEIRRSDISRVDATSRDPARVGRLMASVARHVSTRASVPTLAADVGGQDGPLAETTVRDYLAALERLMVLEDQPAWNPHLRSRSRLRRAAKRHFVDPSLAAAALGASPESLLQDLEFFGFLFESLVIRDLRVLSQRIDAEVLQYEDNTGLEIDAIVRRRNGDWAAFAVKLGQRQVDDAAKALLKLRDERVDTARAGSPSALAVVVASGLSYLREDGVAVVAIGALGP
jgi:predicted AAA+ superfamily ATPase